MLFISKSLPYSFCACVRNTPKIVTFVIGKMKLVSFSLFLDAFPPRPKMPFTYVVNVHSDMSLSKGHLGSRGRGEASKNKLKDTSFIFPMTNVTLLDVFHTHAQKEYGKVLEMKRTSILNILALLFF